MPHRDTSKSGPGQTGADGFAVASPTRIAAQGHEQARQLNYAVRSCPRIAILPVDFNDTFIRPRFVSEGTTKTLGMHGLRPARGTPD
jgi:hypothetical protein